MPNIASVLKDEIRRLAKKEARALTLSLAHTNGRLRHDVAALKKELKSLQTQTLRWGKAAARHMSDAVGDQTEETKARITSRTVATIRRKLGLSQEELGRLIGVHKNTVMHWEAGRMKPQGRGRGGILSVRGIGRKEAKARLAGKPASSKPGGKKQKGRGRRRAGRPKGRR